MTAADTASQDLRRVVRVVVPAADMQARLDAKIEEARAKINLKGFRPGKAPASHLKKLYGPSLMQEIINETLQARSGEAIAEAAVRPAGEPRLELESDINAVMAGSADLAFRLEIDVMPDFTPPDPSALTIERPVAPVTDDDVDEQVRKIAEANRTFNEKDGAAAEGDQLTIDFVGRIDGEAFEGGSAEDATLVIGSKQFIPGFEDQLIGAVAGEARTVAVTFPEDYPVERLKSKAAEFETTVKTIRTPADATPDDALAERLGLEGGLDKLREIVRDGMTRDRAGLSRTKAKRNLFDQLDKALDFPLPPTMLEAEFEQIWAQVGADREAGQVDPDDEGKTEDEIKASYRRIAERRVRLGLALAEIGNKAGVRVEEAEVNAALNAQLRRFPGREREVLDFYRRNANAMAQIRAPLFEEKVVDYILELATVTDKEVSRDELLADDPIE